MLICVTWFASCVHGAPATVSMLTNAFGVDSQDGTGIETRSHHSSYWLETIHHNGASPYNNDSSFVVYRNVMEYVQSLSIILS
jgi:hypothetical protein